jgi:hypothetical protein
MASLNNLWDSRIAVNHHLACNALQVNVLILFEVESQQIEKGLL